MPNFDTSNLTALYGGAFDPPHNGHVSIIEFLLTVPEVSEIWMVPSGNRPDKPDGTHSRVRLTMCELVIAEKFHKSGRVRVCDYHATGACGGFGTIDLLRYCRTKHPDKSFGVVIGNELVSQVGAWHKSEELRSEGYFIITPRNETEVSPEDLRGLRYLSLLERDFAKVNVSSSEIRNRIHTRAPIRGLVPEVIEKFVASEKLYL